MSGEKIRVMVFEGAKLVDEYEMKNGGTEKMYAKQLTPDFVNVVIDGLKRCFKQMDKYIGDEDEFEVIKIDLIEVLEIGIKRSKKEFYYDSVSLTYDYLTYFNTILDCYRFSHKKDVEACILSFITMLHQQSQIR